MDITKLTHGDLTYYLSDPHPSVLFLSGMHGDEYESGKLLEQWLTTTHPTLPAFLSIPSVSPSAIAKGTRNNKFGNDINRQFFEGTNDTEAYDVMNIIRQYAFRYCIDIHEDPERAKAFYLYDSGHMTKDELERYRTTVHQTEARLYTGIDDIDDKHLGCDVEKGYYSFRQDWLEDVSEDAGFSSKWMIRKGIAKRVFTVEIPGKATPQLKRSLIESVVPFLVSSFGVQ